MIQCWIATAVCAMPHGWGFVGTFAAAIIWAFSLHRIHNRRRNESASASAPAFVCRRKKTSLPSQRDADKPSENQIAMLCNQELLGPKRLPQNHNKNCPLSTLQLSSLLLHCLARLASKKIEVEKQGKKQETPQVKKSSLRAFRIFNLRFCLLCLPWAIEPSTDDPPIHPRPLLPVRKPYKCFPFLIKGWWISKLSSCWLTEIDFDWMCPAYNAIYGK